MVEFLPQATSTPISQPLPLPPPCPNGAMANSTSFTLSQPHTPGVLTTTSPFAGGALATPTFSKPLPLATSTPLLQPPCIGDTTHIPTQPLLPVCSGSPAPPTLAQSWDKGEMAGSGGGPREEGPENSTEQKMTSKAAPKINTRKTRKQRFSARKPNKKRKEVSKELRKKVPAVMEKGSGRKKKLPNMEKLPQVETNATSKGCPNMEGNRYHNKGKVKGNKCPNKENRGRRKREETVERTSVSRTGPTCNSSSQHDTTQLQSTYTFATSPVQTTHFCTSRPSQAQVPPPKSSATRPLSMYPQGVKFLPDPLTTQPLHQENNTKNPKVTNVTNYFRPQHMPMDVLIPKGHTHK